VGIVGLGGIGSIVALELAHLGVKQFILVDDDAVETTNLNRLVGATTKDVGKPKTMISKRLIKSVKRSARVTELQVSVRSNNALQALKSADIMMGCVDSDSGRMILNELALAYMIPYIDCGAGINVHNGEIVEAGGRVVVWVPGRPCLLCAKEFIPRIAAEELESPEEREFRRRYGYVSGADVKEPAVISLNGTIASLAVTELLALITGFRASRHYTIYDMLQQEVAQRTVYKDKDCIVCASEGLGDKSVIERYSNQVLPLDIPALE
jgi:molybdopterin/thiamine biosynthesis adenylyltransferase